MRTMPDAPTTLLACRTSWGDIAVTARSGRVTASRLPPAGARSGAPAWKGASVSGARPENREVIELAEACVRGWFEGARRPVPAVLLPQAGPFVRDAWQALMQIPWGKTCSYAGLAAAAGSPRAARAAGSACGANEIPLFVPCHRVLAASGRPGGFGAGLAWKRFLLAAEGMDAADLAGFPS